MKTIFSLIRTFILFPIVFLIKWVLIVVCCIVYSPGAYIINNLCTYEYKTFLYICEWDVKNCFDEMMWEFFKF